MCFGSKAKAPRPIAPPPPPPPPPQQPTVQEAVQAEKVDKRRNQRRGMGAKSQPVESMLTGNAGVSDDAMKRQLGGTSLLGGSK